MADNKNSNEIVYFLYSNYHVKIGKCAPKNQDINSEANQDAVIGRLKGCQTGNPHKNVFQNTKAIKKSFKTICGKGSVFEIPTIT